MFQQLEDKVFSYPIDAKKLEIKEIDGIKWVPFCGNKVDQRIVDIRKECGGFSGRQLEVGWHITYRPIDCVSVKAIGWMSEYC